MEQSKQTTRKIILGTVQFGLAYGINNKIGKPNEFVVSDILDLSYNNGIDILDTAEAYGNSMEVIGKYHRNSNHKFKIITKFSSFVENPTKNVIDRIEMHLKTLNVNELEAYLFHSFKDYKNYINQFRDDLIELKNSNKIKKIGVSLYTNEEIENVLEDPIIGLIQVPFNLLDNLSKRQDVFKKAKEKGIEIHCRSVFLQGLFFKNKNWIKAHIPDLYDGVKQIKELTSEKISVQDLAMNYAFQNKYIDHVVIGVDSKQQLNNNLDTLKNKLSDDVMNKINQIEIENINMLNPSNWKI